MFLTTAKQNECVYASLSMLLDNTVSIDTLKKEFVFDWETEYPFATPFEDKPRVPTMDEICLYLFRCGISLTPFNYDPWCAPSVDTPPVRVWQAPKNMFNHMLTFGEGVVEGRCPSGGHMVAWNGSEVLDPRGYMYSMWDADKFNFKPVTFWLRGSNG